MLIIRPEGGLGNRLRTIAASITLAREIGCTLRIFWWIGRYSGINTYFTQLFEKTDEFKLYEASQNAIIPRLLFDSRFPWVYTTTGKKNVEMMCEKIRHQHGRGVFIASLWANFMGKPDYSWIKLTGEMDHRVKRAKEALFGDREYIGLHIRRTDNRADGVKDALIDFMLLAGSKRLYGSYKSSFSEEATNYGGCELISLHI